jgi:hypothetical protein
MIRSYSESGLMRFAVAVCCGIGCLAIVALAAQTTPRKACAAPQAMADDKYKPGQVWSYKTRPGESTSTITILRIESLPKVGEIVHVRIEGFRFTNCTGGPAPSTIQHVPIARAALDDSVVALLRTEATVPDYEAGYNTWRSDCGGVYTIGVAQILDVDDATFQSGLGCKTHSD